MNIIATTTHDGKTMYKLTKGANLKRIQDSEGAEIIVKNYIHYEDVKASGEVMQILAIEDQNGTMYATNSPTFREAFLDPTFREAFLDIAKMCGDDPAAMIGEKVIVTSGISKAGRKYFICTWA